VITFPPATAKRDGIGVGGGGGGGGPPPPRFFFGPPSFFFLPPPPPPLGRGGGGGGGGGGGERRDLNPADFLCFPSIVASSYPSLLTPATQATKMAKTHAQFQIKTADKPLHLSTYTREYGGGGASFFIPVRVKGGS